MPTAALASTTCERTKSNSRSSGLSVTPRSARRSASPSCSRRTRGARAMSRTATTAAADSSSGTTGVVPAGDPAADSAAPSTSSKATSSAADSAFATQSPASPGPTTAAASTWPNRPGLIRTHQATSGGAERRKAATAERAASLPAGGTASSRSMITASAPRSAALASLSGASPGTYRYDLNGFGPFRSTMLRRCGHCFD